MSLAIPVAFWNALCINWLLELIHRLLVASVLCQSWQSGGCSVKSATPALAADWGQKLEGPVSLLLHKMYITYCSMNLKSLKEWLDCCFELWSSSILTTFSVSLWSPNFSILPCCWGFIALLLFGSYQCPYEHTLLDSAHGGACNT